MEKLIAVVETETYLSTAETLLADEERTAIVDMIAADPTQGDLMQGTGGLRKVRVPLPGRGKRGGGRLITFFHDEEIPVFLIALYPKNVQADLTPDQRKAARRMTDAIRTQYRR